MLHPGELSTGPGTRRHLLHGGWWQWVTSRRGVAVLPEVATQRRGA